MDKAGKEKEEEDKKAVKGKIRAGGISILSDDVGWETALMVLISVYDKRLRSFYSFFFFNCR